MSVGDGTIDLHRREVRWADGTRTDLSETEAALLTYLVSNRERAVLREELLSRVGESARRDWKRGRWTCMWPDCGRSSRSDENGDDPLEAIVTVRAHGYMAGPALEVREPVLPGRRS